MRYFKYSFLFTLLFTTSSFVYAQHTDSLEKLKARLETTLVSAEALKDTKFKTIENLILNEPGIYNAIWSKVYNTFREKNDRFILRNLTITFKTFQGNDSNKTSLGFSYKWDYDINKKKEEDYNNFEFLARIRAEGNIAFRKNLNTMDFQSAKLELGTNGFLGGTVNTLNPKMITELNAINQKLALIEDSSELESSPLWNDITHAMGIRNQYHYNFSAAGGWEGSQDFSRSQVTYGLQLRLSAKSYSDKNILSQLNILDYPFALIRYISRSEKTVSPYGAALPVITAGIDLVKPTDDTARKTLAPGLKQFARFRFEAGFRTLLANISNKTLFFNAAYRYFREINAPAPVRTAKLNRFSYFSCSVTAGDTYFISYSYGKLPFDRTDNALYELGFKFNL